ncbi:hypothetical protein [Candidatus Merdisoma sp. JLR.KK006]|uniref:hypothetical protein n=1 Tax=Candidatus Merdisoma sp. JLR.KK006 TaxID=3112626 RepID=UPI002FF1135E
MKVADTILEQLGGNKFLAMTGAKNLLADGNTLRMTLPKNYSRANRLWITLNGDDTYTMDFFRFTAGQLNRRTYQFTADKKESVKVVKGVYCDMLQEIFTATTGMNTSSPYRKYAQGFPIRTTRL